MLFKVIIGTIILIDILLVGCIIHISSFDYKNNQIYIYLYFVTVNINLILVCLFAMKHNNNKKEKKQELLSFIDGNQAITSINDKIDEFINNYYIYDNKVSFIYNIRYDLIANKRKNLYKNLKLKLKNRNEITEEIVREELILLRDNLEEYKQLLEIKINALLELHNIKIVIININS